MGGRLHTLQLNPQAVKYHRRNSNRKQNPPRRVSTNHRRRDSGDQRRRDSGDQRRRDSGDQLRRDSRDHQFN